MFSCRDLLFFLAGAEFFHTLSHILLPYFIKLPVEMVGITWTSSLNFWAILLNAIITIGLIWWAKKS